MTDCRNCRRDTELFLCTLCAKELHALLADLPWLCEQLEITITRQDRLNLGIVGKSSNASPSPVNVGAMELGRSLRNELSTMVRWLREDTGTATPQLIGNAGYARWLYAHAHSIACNADAGVIFREIRAGTEAILRAINPSSRMWCGPCITVVAHNQHGEEIECGVELYAQRDSGEDIQCPRCKMWVNPREQLLTTIKRGDLLPEAKLLETLEVLGEKVSRVRLYDWIKAGSLRPRGYVHHGRIVPNKIRHSDPRVFSLSQARQLKWRDDQNLVSGS